MKRTIISATEARNRFFELINLATNRGDEFTVEKEGKASVRIVPYKSTHSIDEINKILRDMRGVFVKSKKRKYWSIIDTPGWQKKERKYLEKLSEGKII